MSIIVLMQGCAGSATRAVAAQPVPSPVIVTPAIVPASVTPTSRQALTVPTGIASGLPSAAPMLLSIPEARAGGTVSASAPAAQEPPLLLTNAGSRQPGALAPAATTSLALAPTTATAAAADKAPMPAVLIYAPPATQAYFAKSGVDAKSHAQVWENFLRKFDIPYELTTSVERLERGYAAVLLLPSAVVLAERETKAIENFRANGGAVLATWQAGTRDAAGEWRGYGFMEAAFDIKVAGSTEAEADDTFLMPHGDSPVSHFLPAGMRVWMEHAKAWYPLRLTGEHAAAQVLDWSRTVAPGKASAAIVFGERRPAAGKASRAVVFGFPERLWISADGKAIDALAHNALSWLLRLPDVYVPAWPHPFGSAMVLTIDIADTLVDTDLNLSKLVGDLGGKASYYVLTQQAGQSVELIKKIRAQGHEVAFMGDRFDGFKDLSSAAQAKRLDAMLAEMKTIGLDLGPGAGFHAPMELSDKTTERLLQERAFGYLVGGPDASEARLPFFTTAGAAAGVADTAPAKSLVVLPRTQNGPEDLMAEGDAAVGLKTFLAELEVSERMAGLAVVRIPGQSSLTAPQLAEISSRIKAHRAQIWLATAAQVADWWRGRAQVSASVDASTVPPVLTVKIAGDKPMQKPAAVWVNLPDANSALRLGASGSTQKLPKTAGIDLWRGAVMLDGLAPGEYRWQLYFDRPAAAASR